MASFQNGLYKIELENGKIKHYKNQPDNPASLSDNEVWAIYQSRKESKDLWIGTIKGGLNRFDIQTEEFTHYQHQPGNQSSLAGNFVYSVFKDKSGLMWIGTNLGVDKFEPLKPRFQTIPDHAGKPEGLSGNFVMAIHESNEGGDRTVIWIGTHDGLNRFDLKSGLFTSYKHDPENINSISHNRVTKIIESQSGKSRVLWVSTRSGLNKIDLKTNRITRYYISNNDQVHNWMYDLSEDKNGIIWIGTQSTYLYSFDPKTEQFTRYQSHDGYTFTLYLDLSGMLWIGTETGLYKFNISTKEETQYRHIEGDLKSISNDFIVSIFEDRSGILWIGTAGGLNKFDRSTETFTSFSEKDGLSNSKVKGILEDDKGNLWLSTGKGISKFNPNSETFRNFDATDGLHGDAFSDGASYMNRTGEMFFGGKNGLTYFHPDNIKDNTYIPPIVLTDFQIFNKSIKPGNNSPLKKQVSEVNEITLSYDQSIFSFEFAALDYHNPIKNKYAYKMEGVDPDWVYTDASRRFATYTQLDPGEYVFRVIGSNDDGVWNEKGTSILVIITPPWWATTWAYIIYAFIIISIIYFTWKTQLKRIRIKHDYEMSKFEAEKLQEVDGMKSRFFANISHEFRTPLTLIFGPAKDIIEETSESKTKQNAGIIKRNANRLYGLVNQLLDLSKLEAGRMTLETREQNIIPLLKGLVLSFTSLAERKKITLQFNTIEENVNVYIDKDKVEKIITNLLS
ncbi:MAG: two-component regulator propeller domain-containing protein, partial [Calditrichia bacterium]